MLWLSQILVRERNGHREDRLTWILSYQTISLRILKIFWTQGTWAPPLSYDSLLLLGQLVHTPSVHSTLWVYAHVLLYMCVYIHLWRQEVSAEGHIQLLSTLFFKTSFLTKPGTYCSTRQASQWTPEICLFLFPTLITSAPSPPLPHTLYECWKSELGSLCI